VSSPADAECPVVAAEDVEADGDVAIEQIRLGEAELDRLGEARIVDAGAQLLALAHEVALADRQVDQEALERREACRKLELAGRLLLRRRRRARPVRRRALGLLDLEIVLKKPERLDAVA
jgi:hypothetical protein